MWGKRAVVSVVTAAVAATAACARPAQFANGDEAAPAAPIGVVVNNQNFSDVDVFAVSGGMARRLGMVFGNNSGTFSLEPSYSSRPLYIVAAPIGGFGRASSGELNVAGGDTVEFMIGPRLINSGVIIR